ncbi:MAG: phage terminase large subunit [Alphaproteobacteria bacterium]
MIDPDAVLRALLRQDFRAFLYQSFQTLHAGTAYQQNWHLDHLAWRMMAVRQGRHRRLIVNLPPRSLKSMLISIAFPAWTLGHDPAARIIVASYSDDLARKLSRDFRTVMEADWYRRTFPATRVNPLKRGESEIETTARGFRLATSVGGTLTGRGADIIIVDDPAKPSEAMSAAERARINEWFDHTLLSRLDDKARGVLMVVMQRLHAGDLTGHLLDKGGYERIAIPAVAPEDAEYEVGRNRTHRVRAGELLHADREGPDIQDEIRRAIGTRNFAAQYLQEPLPDGGNVFRLDWFANRYERAPDAGQVVQSWDVGLETASSNDYSVCTTWRMVRNVYYLLDVRRERLAFPDLLRAVEEEASRHRAHRVVIEDVGPGKALIQSARPRLRNPVAAYLPKVDKETRATQQSAVVEAGRVCLPLDAPWLAVFLSEILAFPNGRFDDQVDSLVQFLAWAEHTPGVQLPAIDFGQFLVRSASRPSW